MIYVIVKGSNFMVKIYIIKRNVFWGLSHSVTVPCASFDLLLGFHA
jgi:hypothetical protein